MILLSPGLPGLIAAAAFLASSASAEAPRIAAATRLHRCGDETCLMVSGHRQDVSSPIRIARHDVTVEGGRRWHVSLPLQTVRDWSPPAARSIAVEVVGDDGREVLAPLPIGLLGHVTQLAFLDVSAHR